MSFLIHHSLIGSALALITAGTLIGFWNRDPTLNMFGSAVFMLGMTINGLGLIATDVPIDSWSTGDWIACVALAMSLLFTAVLCGVAFEKRRQKKAGASDAQRVGTGFSPR